MIAATVALPAGGIVLGSSLTPTAAAAQVRIVSPEDGGRTSKAAITVRVRVEGKRFRAFAGGRDVTRRFSKRGRIRRARLVQGRHLPVGDTNLLVSAGRGRAISSDQHFFTVTKRRPGALALRLRRDRLPWAAPHLVARTSKRVRETRVWLNGKRVEEHFEEAGDQRGVAGRPGGHLGLRHGVNRLRVYILQRNGISARRTLRFTIPRKRPIASAGSDLRAGVDDRVRLNGRASRPPLGRRASASASRQKGGAGGDLDHSWKIVAAPQGSAATLQQPHSPSSALVPDVAGTYIARLTVSSGSSTSIDEVEVSVPQADEPMGIPIQTITRDGAIQIGPHPYDRIGSWVQLLELDPDTAKPALDQNRKAIAPRAFSPTDEGASALLSAVKGTSAANLVVLSGQGQAVSGLSQAALKDLEQAVELLGGTVDRDGMTPNGALDLTPGQWSLIGRNTLAGGAASQSLWTTPAGVPGLLDGDRGLAGTLNGYLQSVTSAGLQFVSPEFAALDTKFRPTLNDPPSTTQNQIKVGEQLYSSATIPNGAVAIQMLVLHQTDLSLIYNQTFELFGTGSGSVSYPGINQLDAALHRYVGQSHTAGNGPLIILQDFGVHPDGADFPARLAPDWIEDTIPDTSRAFNWSGQGEHGSDLAKHWNGANQHGLGSVAGNVGTLTGSTVGHDIVANYRRPYLNQSRNKVVARTNGGLTVVASANLYQRSSAYIQGQADPQLTSDVGRVTGVLRRNAQTQWALESPAPGAGIAGTNQTGIGGAFDATELVSTVMSPPVPWPCSDARPDPCPTPKEIDAAMAFVARRLFGPGVRDVREQYDDDLINWTSKLETLENVTYPASEDPPFSRATFDALVGVLKGSAAQPAGEFEQIADVDTAFAVLENVIAKSADIGVFDISKPATNVVSAVNAAKANRKLLQAQAQANVGATLTGALGVAASGLALAFVLDPPAAPALAAVPAALGAVSALISLGESVYAFYDKSAPRKQKIVEDDLDLIQDEVQNLSYDFQTRYTAIGDELEHFRNVIKTDSAKLARTDANIGGVWQLRQRDEYRIRQSIVVGVKRELSNALMPIAYKQWLISPRASDINPGAFADQPNRQYNCREGEDRPVLKQPFSTSPFSSMTSVAWNPFPQNSPTGPAASPYTVRALIANDDPIDLSREQDFDGLGDDDTFIESRGSKPPSSLTDPLFMPVTDGDSATEPSFLGMSKEQFFGQEGWTYKRLQCGIPR